MRRIAIPFSVLAALLVGLLVASLTPRTAAQDATPMAAGHGAAGSWRVTVRPAAGSAHPALITFAADGTVLVSEPPQLPPPPNAPFQELHFSSGNGVWESRGEQTAAMTFDLLATDENANPLGAFTVRGTFEVAADGHSFDGQYEVVLTDPTGQAASYAFGTFSGTRITLEAMGTPPAGTPAP